MGSYRKKTIILGVTGGIAIYKSCYLCSYLVKRGIDVIVIMTKNATEFVTPLTFETLTNNKVYIDTFARDFEFEVEHIALTKRADMFVVAPATCNFLGKVTNGICDDMLTTTFTAFKGAKLVCPAMNTGMYLDTANQKNMEKLKADGVKFIEPTSGYLACGDTGVGRMEEPEIIGEAIINALRPNRDLEGKNLLITCGGTIEDIDRVRYLSNYSSGKMGVALALEATERGANVTLISAKVAVEIPKLYKNIQVKSTLDMLDACIQNYSDNDIIIKAAAPCDFRVKKTYENKIKDKELTIEFVANPDIAKAIGEVKGNRKLVVFAAETTDLIKNAKGKLESKKADMIVANDLTEEGAGFNSDTNIVTIIKSNGEVTKSQRLPKDNIANLILDKVLEL